MAYKVIWSDEAVGDLERISQFIGRDSGAYARAVVRRILEGTRRLKTFPRLGRVVPEVEDDDFRELLIYNFRVLYRVDVRTLGGLSAKQASHKLPKRKHTIGLVT